MKKYKTPNGHEGVFIQARINEPGKTDTTYFLSNDPTFNDRVSKEITDIHPNYGYHFAWDLTPQTIAWAIKTYNLTPIEEEFKTGERILVSHDGKDWVERIYISLSFPKDRWICVIHNDEEYFNIGSSFGSEFWLYAKKKPSFQAQVAYETALFLVTVKARSVSILDKEHDITFDVPHFVFEAITGIINQLKPTK